VLGDHPQTKSKIELLKGPYGIYLKMDKTNVTVPEELKPEQLTLEQAIELFSTKLGSVKPKKEKTKSPRLKAKPKTSESKQMKPKAKKKESTSQRKRVAD
jgi:DNA topoisomerase-1